MAIEDVSKKDIGELISLKEKVALVTGGSMGIGKAIAKRFAEAGATVIIAGRNKLHLEAAIKELTQINKTVIAKVMDISNLDSVISIMQEIVDEFGTVDILANMAGVFPNHDTLAMAIEEWNKVININLNGTYNCAREAIKVMLKAGKGGSIIFASSESAYKPGPQYAHYNASKGAIDALMRSLAIEFAPQNIRVNSIAPALIETEGTIVAKEKLTEALGVDDPWKMIANQIPLGRIGTPDDVARIALFCASDLSIYITGHKFDCDGGVLLK